MRQVALYLGDEFRGRAANIFAVIVDRLRSVQGSNQIKVAAVDTTAIQGHDLSYLILCDQII